MGRTVTAVLVAMVVLAGCSASPLGTRDGDTGTDRPATDEPTSVVVNGTTTNESTTHDGADRADRLQLHIAGMPVPGATVTVTVTKRDAPVTSARVLLDGEVVGRTDEDGALDVTLPDTEKTTLSVEHGSESVDAELVFG